MNSSRAIRELAAMYSLLTSYRDAAGHRQVASNEALRGVLQALGVDDGDPAEALRRRKVEIRSRPIEPVTIAWNGRVNVRLNLPRLKATTVDYELRLEQGNSLVGRAKLVEVGPQATEDEIRPSDPRPRPTHQLRLTRPIPLGYHDLHLTVGRQKLQTRVLSAPRECYLPPDAKPGWGVFLPIYALQSKRSWGSGDFTDFDDLTKFVNSRGGSVVATLPLLATFLDQPFEPSPYAPASRLFWNEFYVDVTRIPEVDWSPAAATMLNSSEFHQEIAELRKLPLVDYRRLMKLKRRILQELAATFFESGTAERREAFASYLRKNPAAEDYVRFRATTERQARGWPVWPDRARHGELREEDFDPKAQAYHLYAQWITSEQLARLGERARAGGRGLYLDFPLGVHPDGYDVWRERESFALNVAVGAPPDPFFTKGQNWGFPPLHPQRLRERNYEYFVRSLQHHMQYAGILRLDHVMSLHRLYWIPAGIEATQGVYVQYPAEEMYAVVAIESHRHKTMVVGEDLGTVPAYVRRSMLRHNLRRMFVLQFEARSDSRSPVSDVTAGSIASLNTHDMPTFGSFFHAHDVDSRLQMGLLDEKEAQQIRAERMRMRQALASFFRRRGLLSGSDDDPMAVHDACMGYLSESAADVVLINLEDLWLEQEPQNTPGTSHELPNWRRRAGKTLEEIRSSPAITLRLRTIDLQRKQARNKHD